MRLGIWNITSLTTEERKLVEEMKKYKTKSLRISETKKKGNRGDCISPELCAKILRCRQKDESKGRCGINYFRRTNKKYNQVDCY